MDCNLDRDVAPGTTLKSPISEDGSMGICTIWERVAKTEVQNAANLGQYQYI